MKTEDNNITGKLVFWFILLLIGLTIYKMTRSESTYNSTTHLAPFLIILCVIELFLGSFIWPYKHNKNKSIK